MKVKAILFGILFVIFSANYSIGGERGYCWVESYSKLSDGSFIFVLVGSGYLGYQAIRVPASKVEKLAFAPPFDAYQNFGIPCNDYPEESPGECFLKHIETVIKE